MFCTLVTIPINEKHWKGTINTKILTLKWKMTALVEELERKSSRTGQF